MSATFLAKLEAEILLETAVLMWQLEAAVRMELR